jgi:hypothetical protein
MSLTASIPPYVEQAPVTAQLFYVAAVVVSFAAMLWLVYSRKIKLAMIGGSIGFAFTYMWLQALALSDLVNNYAMIAYYGGESGSPKMGFAGLPETAFLTLVYFSVGLFVTAMFMFAAERRRKIVRKRAEIKKRQKVEMSDLFESAQA